ncbi:transposase [Endozoicomonas gorgoniicola]|uniref:Transposase n=1 Tax=Endozoicomonas gorgoniicola TaxID=1234144 RepID=A0ABT3N2P8_9GAMM|nr:transposase [Endozoicomonas gorgoniicola]MCW7555910.1 transposase [Endozoicomonas gorgoniicola]
MNSHKRKTYSLAFKIEAVERYLENDRNLKTTAEELGVHPATMKHWVKKGINELREQRNSPDTSLETKIKRLENELRRLTEENEILRKAARMFAAQT